MWFYWNEIETGSMIYMKMDFISICCTRECVSSGEGTGKACALPWGRKKQRSPKLFWLLLVIRTHFKKSLSNSKISFKKSSLIYQYNLWFRPTYLSFLFATVFMLFLCIPMDFRESLTLEGSMCLVRLCREKKPCRAINVDFCYVAHLLMRIK